MLWWLVHVGHNEVMSDASTVDTVGIGVEHDPITLSHVGWEFPSFLFFMSGSTVLYINCNKFPVVDPRGTKKLSHNSLIFRV